MCGMTRINIHCLHLHGIGTTFYSTVESNFPNWIRCSKIAQPVRTGLFLAGRPAFSTRQRYCRIYIHMVLVSYSTYRVYGLKLNFPFPCSGYACSRVSPTFDEMYVVIPRLEDILLVRRSVVSLFIMVALCSGNSCSTIDRRFSATRKS